MNQRAAELLAIDHVQLSMPAGREDEARHFYGRLLGLLEVPKPPALAVRGGCWFSDPAGAVFVHVGVEPHFRPAARAHPAFVVRRLDDLRDRLRQDGVHVTEDTAIPDGRRFYASDPFGNRIEFIAEPDRGFTRRTRPG